MPAPLATILVPLDGSELAEQALPLAMALARASGAELHLLHVFVPYAARAEMPEAMMDNTEIERRLEEQSTGYLRAVTERVSKELPGKVVADPVRARPIRSPYSESVAVVDHIRRVAARMQPDLIVLATHARGGLGRAWLGSVADALIRRVNAPTLLVHPREDVPVPASTFSHILVPLDGSQLAEEILPLAEKVATLCGARVTLLRVVTPRLVVGDPIYVVQLEVELLEQLQSDAERYLEDIAARLRETVPNVEIAVVVSDSAPRAILDRAAEQGADLIAMTTHGRSGFRRFMLGSVADKIVRGAQVPVLLSRPAS